MKKNSSFQHISFYVILTFLIACQTPQKDIADSIYYNGTILTMEDEAAEVQAIAIKNGKIQAVGKTADIQLHRGDSTRMIDLKGKTLVPGFVDPHSHFAMAMQLMGATNISSPPAGGVKNISDIIKALQQQQETRETPEGKWLVAWGYDPDELEEQRHPNKLDLDEAFPHHPVMLIHVSGHMAAVNSAALDLVGMSAETPNPVGGMIVRLPGSKEPNGVLQEAAWFEARQFLPVPSPEQLMFLLEKTQDFYASQGITTAQDGFTDLKTYQFLRHAAAQDAFKIDVEILAGFKDMAAFMQAPDYQFGASENRLRLTGMKIISDGSPQGKTAFFKNPYLTEVPGCVHDCRGIPILKQAQLNSIIQTCYQNNIQVYTHANGDGAIDMLLTAHQNAIDMLNLTKESDLRTVVIHSQFVRPDQLQQYQKFGFVPSYFTNHAFFWGDTHLKNLGEERANFLSPLKTSLDLGIPFTNHTDFVITPLNQLFTVWSAVSRTSRSGKIVGEKERINPLEALKAITINAAYQHKTEAIKGSLKVGKLADLVILDKNPLTVEIDDIKNIKVLETIKEGETIYLQ